jgi:hypothetical protein
MKLFQQLLVAPAALGLLAPVAVSAAELNIDGVAKYASEEQVTSISQFGDVKPTDWAYQALSNLIERYGCVAGYPDGTYKGGRAMTRFEAAALLNACLDRVTEVTDELKRLMAEFEKELAILKGRVDGLEAKVGELEANQFSTTTKLKGVATMTLGGASNGYVAPFTNLAAAGAAGAFIPALAGIAAEEVAFNYDIKLMLDTSFTGKDLLRTTLRAGNFGGSVFGPGGSALMEVAFQEDGKADEVYIDRLFYNFPIGENVSATFGAKVRQDDPGMLGLWPSAYPADSILDRFTTAGGNYLYNLNLGAGGGITYKKNGWSLSANYISSEYSAPYSYGLIDIPATDGSILGGGFGEAFTVTTQLGYAGDNWGVAAAYTYTDGAAKLHLGSLSLPVPVYFTPETQNVGLSAYWAPKESGFIPSISAGFGYADFSAFAGGVSTNTYSWMVGLQWDDAFMKGNALGFAIGEADTNVDQLAVELFYKFQVTDNISVTPGLFWIENGGVSFNTAPFGGGFVPVALEDSFGAVIKTTFKF